nr:MAG TPA: KilAC domain protein [Caudoviricetes sp.]
MPCVCCVKHTYGGFLFIIIRYNMLDTTNELISTQKGMTSLEIAEITRKRHDAILRDIRNLLKQGVSHHNFVETFYKQPQPRGGYKELPCFSLTPKGCLILASGYDALLRERIINRLEELDKGRVKVPQTFSESLMLAANQARQIENLKEENHLLVLENNSYREKAEFADSIMQSKNCITIGEMANILNQNKIFRKGRNALYGALRQKGYLLKRGIRYNLPTQKSISEGIMRVAEIPSHTISGITINRSAVITPKGQQYFIKMFRKLKGDKQFSLSF